MIKYLVVLNLRILCKYNIPPVRCLFKFKPCFVMFTSDLNFFFKFSFNLLPNNVKVNLVCFSPKLVFLTYNTVRSDAKSSRNQHQKLIHL